MAFCGTIPFSRPVAGFGSSYGLGCGYGYGGLGYAGLGYGRFGGYSGIETSRSLGTLPGVVPSCVGQLPSSEVVIQPPASVVTFPGAVLSASCEPVAVGGHTSCATGGYGYGLGGYDLGGYGLGAYNGYGLGWRRGFLGRRSLLAGSRIYGCFY